MIFSMSFMINLNVQESIDGLSVTLGLAAATGVGILAFSEVWIVQLLFLLLIDII